MKENEKILWFRKGAALGGLVAVGTGAFGAHALKDVLTFAEKEIYQTAVFYLFIHSLALLALSLGGIEKQVKAMRVAMTFFALGNLIFPLSLWLLILTSQKAFGAITPIGGVCYLIAWSALLLSSHSPLKPPKT